MLCPDCGTDNAPGALVCRRCGTQLTPSSPPASPASAPESGRRGWLLAGIAAVVVAVLGLVVVLAGGDEEGGALAGGSIRLEPVDAQTPDPFVEDDLDVGDDPSVSLDEPPNLDDRVTAGLSGRLASGSEPGLYGGSQDEAVCDVAAMLEFLTDPANADRARVWADVQGIGVDDIPQYVGELTPVRLRYDTRVTNHSFVDGEAQPFQSVLQAGTAVLVDREGVPRSRCSCGNPLTEPLEVEGEVDRGQALDVEGLAANPDDAWEGFDPAEVVTVEAGDELEIVVVADPSTGERVEQVPGITYTVEQLQAALPADAELSDGYDSIERCPGGSVCADPEPGQERVGVLATADAGEATWGTGDHSSVFGTVWTDPQARTGWLDQRRADNEERDGQFDIPPEGEAGDAYTAGERGEGTSSTFESGGWEGSLRVSTFVLVNPDGETSGPISSATVIVWRGNATLDLSVAQPGEDQGAVEDLVRQYTSQVVEALP